MQREVSKKSKFSVNLSKLRRERDLSQRQAAAELGISQALLSHYENGAREPKLEFVGKICDYYSVTIDYLLGRSKERGDGASRLTARVSEVVDSLEKLKSEEVRLMNDLRMLIKDK